MVEQEAKNQLELIKETIAGAKIEYHSLAVFFLIYAIIQGALYVSPLVLANFVAISYVGGINFVINVICSCIMLYTFIRTYNMEKYSTNRYYVSCICIWGGSVVILPWLSQIVRVMLVIMNVDNANTVMLKLNEYEFVIGIFLFCVACIIAGSILRTFKIVWYPIVFSLICLFIGIANNWSSETIQYMQISVAYFIVLGYIILAIILKRKDSYDR